MISIKAIIDVVGALSSGTLSDSLHLFDDNRRGGSNNQGTYRLATAVKKGDQILWTIAPLECEAYAEITAIALPADICEVTRQTYPGTAIAYWIGTVKETVEDLPYSITMSLGHAGFSLTSDYGPRLIKGTH
jgi:hypothetical protein